MTDASPRTIIQPSGQLGGPGAPDPALCAARAIALLGEVAGGDMRMSSLAIDVTSHPLGGQDVTIAVRVDRRTKSIVFASAEARAGNQLVFAAQGLFSLAG